MESMSIFLLEPLKQFTDGRLRPDAIAMRVSKYSSSCESELAA
jgi:hypothetical protein